jgi:chromosome partitioning protein
MTLKKAISIFGADLQEAMATDPDFFLNMKSQKKSAGAEVLSQLGSRFGFLQRPARPLAISIFVTKGGVLKTSLTLNLARLAALQGLRVCVVGLDMQGDITQALGNHGPDENESLEEALRTLNSLRGLSDLFLGQASLDDLLIETELKNLSFIPETPELVALDQSLLTRNRREYWLQENVVLPLKERFDLIIMDCSPNWNRLINNALVASDVLISPIECRINNFRNLRTFRALIAEFKKEMRLSFNHVMVPTRVVNARRLSREIFEWYRSNLESCSNGSIRESIQGEEATALRLSLAEHAPSSLPASEIRMLLAEIGGKIGIAKPNWKERLILDQAKLGGSSGDWIAECNLAKDEKNPTVFRSNA